LSSKGSEGCSRSWRCHCEARARGAAQPPPSHAGCMPVECRLTASLLAPVAAVPIPYILSPFAARPVHGTGAARAGARADRERARMMSGWKRSAAGPTTSSKAAAIAASPESPACARLPDTECAAGAPPACPSCTCCSARWLAQTPALPSLWVFTRASTCCCAGGCGCAAPRAWHGQVDGEAHAVRGARLAHGARERPAAGLVHADEHDRRVVDEEVAGALARGPVPSALCGRRPCLRLAHGCHACARTHPFCHPYLTWNGYQRLRCNLADGDEHSTGLAAGGAERQHKPWTSACWPQVLEVSCWQHEVGLGGSGMSEP